MSLSGEYPTEAQNEASRALDRLTLSEAFDVFDREDERVNAAVRAAKPEILRAIELVAEALARGGRLIYAGAGTSGRLGVLDASECPPTFQSAPEQVQGRVAGGPEALLRAIEGAEDSLARGRAAMDDVGPLDVVFGIAASGRTPWVHAALERAKERGAATIFLACVPFSGPVTTLAFARLGKVHENLMIDLDTRANAKLRRRGLGILHELTGLAGSAAETLLDRAGGRVKVAALMQLRSLGPDEARALLAAHGDSLRRALEGSRAAGEDSPGSV